MNKESVTNGSDLTDKQVAQRMEKALRRALSTPPRPHTAKGGEAGSKAASKPRQKEERES